MYHLIKYGVMPGLVVLLAFAGCTGVQEPGEAGILVSTDWLQDHLNDPDLVLLHSGSDELYDSVHIPGARLIDPYDFTMNVDGVRNQMPPPDSIVDLIRNAGAGDDSKIVLYYESSSIRNRTARLFVALDHAGFGKQTFVLNGGLPAWQEEERETSDLIPAFAPGKLKVRNTKEVVITADELDLLRWSNDVVVIDARSDEEYYGTPETEEEPAEGGHIEGAYFLPYQDLLDEDKPYLLKPDTELKELFKKAGMDPEKRTIVYCGSGIRACISYLAAQHLGYPVLLYDGSYEEWTELDMTLTGPVDIPDKKE